MEEVKASFKKARYRYSKNVKIISIIGTLLCLLGIADATYLTVAHYTTKLTLACPDKGFINCARVTQSSYSVVFGIPVALLGLLFFVGMVVLQTPMFWNSLNKLIRVGRLGYSIVGLITVFWLVYVEFHKLNAICLYCSGVHILTFCLFVVTIIGNSIIIPKSNSSIAKE
jgi:uncharacterized membrane protein